MDKCIEDIYSIYDIFDREIKVIIIERQEYTLDEIKEKYPKMDIDNIRKR
jgi:hypothetical protein